MLEAKFSANDIESRLAECMLPLLTSLYERFGVAGLSLNRVEAEVQRLLNSPISKERRPRR